MRYALGRMAYLFAILVVVTFLVSAMLELMPGDPAFAILGENPTPEQIRIIHEKLRLDDPLYERYGSWISDVFRGDLGSSIRSDTPVIDDIRQRFPVTLEVVIGAQILALLYAIPTVIYSAYRPGKSFDGFFSVWSFGMISIPHFVLALILILVFAVNLGWFPVGGYTPISENLGENLRCMVLPWIAVAVSPSGIYQRLLRSDMTATLREDYIAMAEAKGLSPRRILLRHALRPSMFSLMTLVGLTIAQMLGGTVVVEIIFGLPGLGRLLIESINLRDVVMIQGVVAVIGVGYVLMNGVVDLLYGAVDPRVRRGR